MSLIAEDYGGGAVFNNHLFRSQLNYQFTRELSLRTIVDYNGVLPNTALIDSSGQAGDCRFSADVARQSGTAFYLGYTDTHQDLRDLPRHPGFCEEYRPPSSTTGRQLFIKVSYLIRR